MRTLQGYKKILDECTIEYDFTDVDLLSGEERDLILEDVKKYNPRCTFPTIYVFLPHPKNMWQKVSLPKVRTISRNAQNTKNRTESHN